MKKMKCQFGIKYKATKINEHRYVFVPIGLVKGEETSDGFLCNNGKIYPIFYDTIGNCKTPYIDMIFCDDELAEMLEYEGDDEDFVGKFAYETYYKDVCLIVDMTHVNDAGMPYRYMVNLEQIIDEKDSVIYYMDESIPNVVLNEKAVREIEEAKSLDDIKIILHKYQMGLNAIKKQKDMNGITRVSITGNSVNYYETTRNVDFDELEKTRVGKSNMTSTSEVETREISYQGLRNYIKERIFGHENEIDTFAQKLYMNHTAEDGEPVESILFVGPTGTGKTETVRAACGYLGIPMYEANASNLVTQGIMGTSIEDVITGLYENAGCDLQKAQRGLIFLDEFDKLSDTNLETKAPVKNILLTFTAGGNFPITGNHYNFMFDSTMTNKIYAGVFERVTDKTNPMGFGAVKKVAPLLGTDEELRKKIVEKKYFTNEELTRISTILAYDDLTRDTKKDILLHSKLSEYAKKRERYLRQFGIELVADDSYIDAVLDKIASTSTGMRSVNNFVKRTINNAERAILENEDKKYKRLVLTRETVDNPNKFDLSK